MGYTTEFTGHVTVAPPLNEHEVAYLNRFADTRRMKRGYGPYYCGTGSWGQDREADIIDYNHAPDGQPGLWCQWRASSDGSRIEWDGGEKFYDADQWMRYLIDTFLKPGGRVLYELDAPVEGRYYAPEFDHFTFDHVVNGVIAAQGEQDDDRWELHVVDNEVAVKRLPTAGEQVAEDPRLAEALATLQAAGITPGQYAGLTGQDW